MAWKYAKAQKETAGFVHDQTICACLEASKALCDREVLPTSLPWGGPSITVHFYGHGWQGIPLQAILAIMLSTCMLREAMCVEGHLPILYNL